MTKKTFRLFALIAGLLVAAAASYNLYRLWEQPLDRYWTPRQFALALDGVNARAEVLMKGEPIAKLVSEGKVVVNDVNGPVTLAPADFTVRLNNYDQERLRRVPAAIVSSGALGAGLVLFLLGLFAPSLGGMLPKQRELTQLHLLEQ